MAIYNTNADLSADAAGTNADIDSNGTNRDSITGFRARIGRVNDSTRVFTVVDSPGTLGGKSVEYRYGSGSGTPRCVALTSTGLDQFATTDEIDILCRFRHPGTPNNNFGVSIIAGGDNDSDNANGYAMRWLSSSGTWRLWYTQGSNYFAGIGAEVVKTLSGNTWYWLRVHRMGTSHEWSWKIWAGDYGDEPAGWDEGDGSTGGSSNSDVATGFAGCGLYTSHTNDDLDIDWISAADAGDTAPGPVAPGPTITPSATSAITPTTATGNVTADDTPNGTMYGRVYAAGTDPTADNIIDGTGPTPVSSATPVTVTTAPQAIVMPVTGLLANTAYQFAFAQVAGDASRSDPAYNAFSTFNLVTGSGAINSANATVSGIGTVTAPPKTVSLTAANNRELRDENGNLLSFASIRWEWYDTTDDTSGDPVDSGVDIIDLAGELVLTLTNTALSSGQNGTLIIYLDSDPLAHGIYRVPVD